MDKMNEGEVFVSMMTKHGSLTATIPNYFTDDEKLTSVTNMLKQLLAPKEED